LIWATSKGQVEVARLLIERGANVDFYTRAKLSPLFQSVAVATNAIIAKMLLDKGAEVDCKSTDSSTPLMYAAVYGDVELTRLLIEHKANVNHTNMSEFTPLLLASSQYSGKLAIVQLLVGAGADVNHVASKAKPLSRWLFCAITLI